MEENKGLILTQEQVQMTAVVIQQIMGPVMTEMTKLLRNNTEALNQLAGAQQLQADRLEAMERQIRLNTLVTPQQVKYINDAIRARSRELLDKREIEDEKAVRKLGNAIRKSVLARYGVGALHEIPKHEYSVAMNHVATWNDMLCVRDVVKEARLREKEALAAAEPDSAWAASSTLSGPMD